MYALMVVCALIHSVNPIDAWSAAQLASGTAAELSAEGVAALNVAEPVFVAQELVYYAASAGGMYSWWHFLWVEVSELRNDSDSDLQKHYSSFWNIVDAVNLAAVPSLILPTTILSAAHSPQAAHVAEALVPLSSLLQLTLALRMLQYVSLYRPLGPLLVTVGGMIRNIVQFFGVYAFVLFGFADAIFVLFNASPEVIDGSVRPVSYQAIITQMVLWVLGEIDFALLEQLHGVQRVLGFGLFWANTMLTVFVLLNLLIAVLNTTYEQVTERAFNEWLFLRLNTMLEFESSSMTTSSGLDEYFIEVEELNNRRTVELSIDVNDPDQPWDRSRR